MRYRAYLDSSCFFDTEAQSEELALSSASVTLKAGESGSFTFTVPQPNIKWGYFNKFTHVYVLRDSERIFSGRVYDVSEDFYLSQTVTCEGMLAVFNDTVLEPASYDDTTLDALLTAILSAHNTQVGSGSFKAITKGTIEFSDLHLTKQYEKNESTLTRLKSLVEDYGGLLRIRYDSGYKLDWLEDNYGNAKQTIDFGENLLDVKQQSGIDDIITVLYPFGAEVTDESTNVKYTVDISEVNEGKKYLEADSTTLANYGRVAQAIYWTDITTPQALLSKATEYLNEHKQSKLTINLSAVDLALVNSSVNHFGIGEMIRVNSSAHGFDGDNNSFLCQSMTLNLLSPGSDRLTLNQTEIGFIKRQRDNLKDNINDVQQQIATNETRIEEVAESIKDVVDDEIVKTAVTLDSTEWKVTSEFASGASAYMSFDAEKGLCIGRKNSSGQYENIHSEQDNDEYKFVDKNGNVLMKIDTDGTHSDVVEVDEQILYSAEGSNQWATRRGDYISNVGYNLDDVWIGG